MVQKKRSIKEANKKEKFVKEKPAKAGLVNSYGK